MSCHSCGEREENPVSIADEDAAHELVLAAENEGALYPQKQAILRSLARKKKRGEYVPELACKAWEHWVEAAARIYAKENLSHPDEWKQVFNAATRRLAAKEIERIESQPNSELDFLVRASDAERRSKNPVAAYAENPRRTVTEAERFFYKHAGYARAPGESVSTARHRMARALAHAEKEAERRGWRFVWEDDVDVDVSWMDEEQLAEYRSGRVEVLVCALKDSSGTTRASIGGVTLRRLSNARDPYARVVEAELADEALALSGASEQRAGNPIGESPRRPGRPGHISVPTENQKALEAEIVKGIAEVFHYSAWADVEEQHGRSAAFSGRRIEDVAPPVTMKAMNAARKFADDVVQMNGKALAILYLEALAADAKEGIDEGEKSEPRAFGSDLGMQGLGHGVSWFDDHAEFPLTLPRTEFFYTRGGRRPNPIGKTNAPPYVTLEGIRTRLNRGEIDIEEANAWFADWAEGKAEFRVHNGVAQEALSMRGGGQSWIPIPFLNRETHDAHRNDPYWTGRRENPAYPALAPHGTIESRAKNPVGQKVPLKLVDGGRALEGAKRSKS